MFRHLIDVEHNLYLQKVSFIRDRQVQQERLINALRPSDAYMRR